MNAAARAHAFRELERIYAEADRALGPGAEGACRGDGACCRFDRSGLRLFATPLEAAYLRARAGPPAPGAPEGACPYLQPPRCTAREGRPLGCRLYFCDPAAGARAEALYETFHRRIAELHRRFRLPYGYRELFPAEGRAAALPGAGTGPAREAPP